MEKKTSVYITQSQDLLDAASRRLIIACLSLICRRFPTLSISLRLIERLIKLTPDNDDGIKYSSANRDNMNAMLDRGWGDFRIFARSEIILLQNMRGGGPFARHWLLFLMYKAPPCLKVFGR